MSTQRKVRLGIVEYGNSVRATFSLQCFYPCVSERLITITGSKAYLFGSFQKSRSGDAGGRFRSVSDCEGIRSNA